MATVAKRTAPAAFHLSFSLYPASDEGICPRCSGETHACQPDDEDPDRLLEVCTCCGEWIYRCQMPGGNVRRVAILGGIDSADPCSPPRVRLTISLRLAEKIASPQPAG